jgi:hypothetical protein
MERVGKKRIHSSHNTKPNQHHDWQRGWDCRTRFPGVLFRDDLNFIWSTTRNFILSTVYILPYYPNRIKAVGHVADVIVGVLSALLRRRSAARQRNVIYLYLTVATEEKATVSYHVPHHIIFLLVIMIQTSGLLPRLPNPLRKSVHFHQYTSPFATLPSVLFYKEGLYISMQYSIKPWCGSPFTGSPHHHLVSQRSRNSNHIYFSSHSFHSTLIAFYKPL